MNYNYNDDTRPPNYCGVDFGVDCCPKCGGEVYVYEEGWDEESSEPVWYYDYDVPHCKNRKPKNRWEL
jgi:hypothetical protein